jgi:hypothetical protein
MILFASVPSWCEPPYAPNGIGVLVPDYSGKAMGMGGAYTALANDITAAYWNPAGLISLFCPKRFIKKDAVC